MYSKAVRLPMARTISKADRHGCTFSGENKNMSTNNLRGARVALLEARMSGELANLVRRHGGEPYCAPAVRESPLECREEVAAFINKLTHGAFQVVIFLTGVGVKALLREAEQIGRLADLLAALKNVTTVCRGPKPVAVLKQNAIPVSVTAREPHTTAELLEALADLDLKDKGVALLHYGERNTVLTEALRTCGARLDELCLYEWLMPEETGPLKDIVKRIINGQVDAIAFTSQIQIRHLFQIAGDMGQAAELIQALNDRIIVTSVGPTCTATLQGFGITPRVVPEHPKMGPMVVALAQYIEQNGLPRSSISSG